MTLERIKDAPEQAFPLVIAPFIAITYEIDRDRALIDAPALKAKMEERLRSLAEADEAHISSDSGEFEIIYERPPGEEFPSRISVLVAPWQDADSGIRGMRRLSEMQVKALHNAVKRVWDLMREHLGVLTLWGFFRVIAKERTPLAEDYTYIPPRIWSYFRVEDWAQGVSLCELSQDRLWDVRLEIRRDRPTPASATAKDTASCTAWLKELRSNNKPPLHNKIFYQNEARDKFDVGSHQFKNCWTKAALEMPNTLWGKPGRPKQLVGGFQSVGQ